MTKDNAEKLLLAFSLATTAGDTAVADLLESVILEVMVDANQPPITIGGNKATIEPPWKIEATPLFVPRAYAVNTTTEYTGIDTATREVMS